MPDGKRKRRFSKNLARRRWYALHRAFRFRRRFGVATVTENVEPLAVAVIASFGDAAFPLKSV